MAEDKDKTEQDLKDINADFQKMIDLSADLKKNSSKARDEFKQATALTEGRFKAQKRLDEATKQLTDLYIKHNRVVDVKQIKKKAKQMSKSSVKKEKLGLTQGDKLWGKEGIKSRVSKGAQFGMHAMGMATENPVFNLAANALGKRRERISQARHGVYNEDQSEKDAKKKQNKAQNEDQEKLETDTGSSKGNGKTDSDSDFGELVAEAVTANKLLTLLVSDNKEEIALFVEEGKQLALMNANHQEALEDEELKQKNKAAVDSSPSQLEEKRAKKDDGKLKRKEVKGGKGGMAGLVNGLGGLTKMLPMLMNPMGLAIAGVAAATVAVGYLGKKAWDSHTAANDDERQEVDVVITKSDLGLKDAEKSTEFGSDERDSALDAEIAKINAQIEAVKVGDGGWLDKNITTEHEFQEMADLRKQREKIEKSKRRNKKKKDGADISDHDFDENNFKNNTDTENKKFFDKRIDKYKGKNDAIEEKMKSNDISSMTRENLRRRKETNDLVIKLAQEGLTSGSTKMGVVQHPELAKGEKVKKYTGIIKEEETTVQDIMKSVKAVVPFPTDTSPTDKAVTAEESIDKTATKTAEVLIKKIKAEPIPKKEDKFSEQTSQVETKIQKEENAAMAEVKAEGKRLFHDRVVAFKKHGKDSAEYKKANFDFSLVNNKKHELRNEIEYNRSNRDGQRRIDISNFGTSKAVEMEAKREHEKQNKSQAPIVIPAPATSAPAPAPEQKTNVTVSSGDNLSFGSRLAETH